MAILYNSNGVLMNTTHTRIIDNKIEYAYSNLLRFLK